MVDYTKETEDLFNTLNIEDELLQYLDLYIRDVAYENKKSNEYISGMKDILNKLRTIELAKEFNKEE